MIKNACQFPPGEVKPESIHGPRDQSSLLKRILNKKILVLLASLLALIIVYSRNYSSLNWGGSPVLFQDWYIVKMSFYTYISGMITYYFREYRPKKKAKRHKPI
jgi:hypothetical protein